jgi:hypothetical protein
LQLPQKTILRCNIIAPQQSAVDMRVVKKRLQVLRCGRGSYSMRFPWQAFMQLAGFANFAIAGNAALRGA